MTTESLGVQFKGGTFRTILLLVVGAAVGGGGVAAAGSHAAAADPGPETARRLTALEVTDARTTAVLEQIVVQTRQMNDTLSRIWERLPPITPR
jgi:hypothetical protein